jgi:formylmethanofuran dehydrogenase subunit D
MEAAMKTGRTIFNGASFDFDNDTTNLSKSQQARDVQSRMPQTKTGLGSSEGDLVVLTKKYLEIVGLVFFVWLLGEYEMHC